jgi:hypothetical protein
MSISINTHRNVNGEGGFSFEQTVEASLPIPERKEEVLF